MKKYTQKEAAAYLKISLRRVKQLSERMLLGEDYWYEEVYDGRPLCYLSEEAVQQMANRNTSKSGRPRKYPKTDAPKRPRGRPRKEQAPV